MKIVRILLIALFVTILPLSSPSAQGRELTILHTNDLHSNLLGFSPNLDYQPQVAGGDATRGGLARVAAILSRERARRTSPVLTLDGGDFLMGTLFHMLSREEAMELVLMKEMGYDALVPGNHEFDLKPRGLAKILEAAAARGGLPQLVLANAIFSAESDKDDSLEAEFKKGRVKPYIVIERGGLRIGIFGIMGKDAAEKAPFASPVKFGDPLEVSRRMVQELREKERVDLVVCLSHSGVNKRKKISEDENLAKNVPGIDVIIGGHSHTKLDQPLQVNSTFIVQAESYGKYVGVMDLVLEQGKVALKEYKLHPVDGSIAGDAQMQARIEGFIAEIDKRVLKEKGYGFYQTIARTDFDLTVIEEESPLGNLIADGIRWYANKYDYDPKDPVTKVVMAIESNGVIREDLLKGKTGRLAVTDIFRAVPLGIGMDDTMGYPLLTCYLYASEIKKALEVLTSVYPLKGDSYFLQVSGVKFTYNPRRMLFDRVTGIWLGSEEEGYKPLDYSARNRELYRVVANIYNATFLKIIGGFTYQILTIVPKDRQGKPIAELADFRIDADKTKSGIQEVKEWVVIMEYLAGFPAKGGDRLPTVPEKYRGKLGRIVSEASYNPISLLSRGTWVTWAALGAIVFVLLLVALVIYLIRRLRRRRKYRKLGQLKPPRLKEKRQ
ncbi:MAG: bifunctional UDP-sugar hydrolase/5'-nucleotidase [Smithellaceae bacterium]|nr:bifunctional UDP-sugar hydrolase/5'-nucleotidase [Smithellaceae bacterium]